MKNQALIKNDYALVENKTQLVSLRQNLTPSLRRIVPMPIRIERVRALRYPSWLLERSKMARRRVNQNEEDFFKAIHASHRSPLCRIHAEKDSLLQRGKEINVRIAAALLDGLIIEPNQIFSYHHVVGRPSYARGFVDGPELRDGQPSKGVGGGCCQITNMLFWMAINANLTIVERHRHSLDLYPDENRIVPFGCGATVFYNQADLRFRNEGSHPILIDLKIKDGELIGKLRSLEELPYRVEIYEHEHAFDHDGDQWWRSNIIRKRLMSKSGTLIDDQELLRNRSRVLYDPRKY